MTPPEAAPLIRVIAMPADTNPTGDIFGGWLMAQMDRAVAAEGLKVRRLPSGAGHDGMALCSLADIAMLFVRCERGISHNPAEAVAEADVAVALDVLERFLGALG